MVDVDEWDMRRSLYGVAANQVFFSLDRKRKSVRFVDAVSQAALPAWSLAESTAVRCVTSWGRLVVAVCEAGVADLFVRIYDVTSGREVSVSRLSDFDGVACVVNVLQVNPVWVLLAVGCEEGQCVLLRQALSSASMADSPVTRLMELDKFFSNTFLPLNTVAVAARHVAAGIGPDRAIASFAWLENQLLAVGYHSGPVLINRILGHGHVLTKHAVVNGESAPLWMVFPSALRLVVSRDDGMRLEMIQLAVKNELLEARAVASRQLPHELVWLGASLAGLVSYAVHDKQAGSIALVSEPHTDLPFDFGPPHTVLASGAPRSVAAIFISVSPDQSTLVRVAGEDGTVASAESFGAPIVLLREVLAAGRTALEPPLSRSLWKRGAEAGIVAAPFVANATDDEAAEVIMQLCVEKDCLGVLESTLRHGGMTARVAHLREWTKRYCKTALAQGEEVLKKRDDLMAMELTFALFGSLYRLQESLATHSQGSEQIRVECEASASVTLAHAQRLEVCLWLASSGLMTLNSEREFPVAAIDTASRARRKALSNEFLFADYLWHHMNTDSAVPDGSCLWPPASFSSVLDAMAASLVVAPVRHAVLLYALLDAAALGSAADAVERCASRLGQNLGFPPQLERRVRALWMIDHVFDTAKAANELAEVGFGDFGETMAMLAVKRLRIAGNVEASLRLLRSLPDAATAEAVDVSVASYLAGGAIQDALLLCRRIGDMSAFLIFLARCDCEEGQLSRLVRLPLSLAEENVLFSFTGALASETGREARDLLVLYLLLRGRTTEAVQLWTRVRSLVAAKREDDAKQVDAMIAKASESVPSCLTSSSPLLMASLFQPPVYSVAAVPPQLSSTTTTQQQLDNIPADGDLFFGSQFMETSPVFSRTAESAAGPTLSTPVRSIKKR